MTEEEKLRQCLLLSFQAVLTQGGNLTVGARDKINALARRMNEFCELELKHAFPQETIKLVDDKWTAKIDADIAMYREDLEKRGSTTLSQDHETLIQLYDRMSQRAFRARNWLFYADAKEEQLIAAITHLLAEEIKNSGGSVKV